MGNLFLFLSAQTSNNSHPDSASGSAQSFHCSSTAPYSLWPGNVPDVPSDSRQSRRTGEHLTWPTPRLFLLLFVHCMEVHICPQKHTYRYILYIFQFVPKSIFLKSIFLILHAVIPSVLFFHLSAGFAKYLHVNPPHDCDVRSTISFQFDSARRVSKG